MSVPLLPKPADGAEAHGLGNDQERCENNSHAGSRGRDQKHHVATEEECLAILSRLPSLVALGLLSTSKANTIRGSCTAILQHYRQNRSPEERGAAADDGMLDMLARHPEFANLLEPFLTAEQIASILARAKDGRDGAA